LAIPTPALLDSGSDICLIRKSFATKFHKPIKPCKSVRLTTASCHKIKPFGKMELEFQLGHKKFNYTFYVIEKLPIPILIGKDFLKMSDIVMHFRTDTFWFDDDKEGRRYSMFSNKKRSVIYIEFDECTQLTQEDRDKLIKQVLDKYPSVAGTNRVLGRTNIIKHYIDSPDTPVYTPYRYPGRQAAEEIRKQTKDLLEKGLVRESTSPYNSNAVLAPKKNGKMRMTISYKKVNKHTRDNRTPMHDATRILRILPKSKWFSVIDCESGFWQIVMDERSVEKTAFTVDGKHYEFLVMPFGLKNAPKTFVECMNKVLDGVVGNFVFVFVDDIIIFSDTFQDHLVHVDEVLNRLKQANMTINTDKCTFAKQQIKFLGHIINPTGISRDPEKTRAIENYPIPTNISELRRFLGKVGYYQSFIPHYAKLAEPLNFLLRKNVTWYWGINQQKAFDKIKQHMCNEVMLETIDYNYPLILKTDASDIGLGAVLSQCIDGKERVITYASKALRNSERNLSTYEKELLAILWATNKFHDYIFNEDFYILTDNQALKYLHQQKDNSSKMGRWALRLQPYLDRIKFIPGKENVVADALSRAPVSPTKSEPDYMQDNLDVMYVPCFGLMYKPPGLKEIRKQQKTDEECLQIIKTLKKNSNRNDQPLENSEYVYQNELLYRITKLHAKVKKVVPQQSTVEAAISDIRSVDCNDHTLEECPNTTNELEINSNQNNNRPVVMNTETINQINSQINQNAINNENKSSIDVFKIIKVPVIPKVLTNEIMYLFHDMPESGHLGIRKTLDRIKSRAFWSTMDKDIKEYIRTCDTCQKVKCETARKAGLLGLSESAPYVFHTIYADFIGPLPTSARGKANKYALVIQDKLSKWVEIFPMRTATSQKLAEYLEFVFCHFGSPKVLVTDNGSQFVSNVIKKLCKEWKIKHTFTSVYHPQGNQAERSNRNLKTMIKCYLENNQSAWDVNLQKFGLALRSAVHETTKVTPALINLGRQIAIPFDREFVDAEDIDMTHARRIADELPSQLKDIVEWVRDNIVEAQITYKDNYDKRHRDVKYNSGDKVLIRNHVLSDADLNFSAKLAKPFLGPYNIKYQITPVTYMIQDNNGVEVGKRHVSDIKP